MVASADMSWVQWMVLFALVYYAGKGSAQHPGAIKGVFSFLFNLMRKR